MNAIKHKLTSVTSESDQVRFSLETIYQKTYCITVYEFILDKRRENWTKPFD